MKKSYWVDGIEVGLERFNNTIARLKKLNKEFEIEEDEFNSYLYITAERNHA